MDTATCLCFTNVNISMAEPEFKAELLRIFPTAFAVPAENGELVVNLYRANGMKRKGTVKGFQFSFQEIRQTARGNQIKGRSIIVHKDEGDPRDEYGEFIKPMTPQAVRARQCLQGELHRKCFSVFNKQFLEKMNKAVFNGNQKAIYLNSGEVKRNTLGTVGRILFHFSNQKLNSTKIRYSNCLETMQAIRYFNMNPMFGSCLTFTDESRQFSSVCNDNKGIGKFGSILSIKGEANQTIVQLADLDPDLLDNRQITDRSRSYCWRCGSSFKLVGVEADLKYVTGICLCQYTGELGILDNNRAYNWPGEGFTRLIPGQSGPGRLIIYHRPMQPAYDCSEDYKNIVLPILQEEWKYYSMEFKMSNKISGILTWSRFVEQIDAKGDKLKNVFAVQVLVPQTKFWFVGNIGCCTKATITLSYTQTMEGKDVLRISEAKCTTKYVARCSEGEGFVTLYVQIALPNQSRIEIIPQDVEIAPKPIKTPYEATKRMINKLVDGIFHVSHTNLFVNPGIQDDWLLEENQKKVLDQSLQEKLAEIKECLNEEQKAALTNAEKCIVSVVHGPPGTGKTHVLSVIAVEIAHTEDPSKILVCAPSNVAANEIAERIQKLGGPFMSVLRVFSKKRELDFIRNTNISATSTASNCAILHEEVRKSGRWMIDDDGSLQTIFQKFTQGDDYCLTKAERELYDQHIEDLEQEVMVNFQVFVLTIGATCDNRVTKWANKLPIDSVIIDEVGKTTQPEVLAALVVNPRRVIFGGDHLQLPPQIQSYSAITSGLNKSIMEFIQMAGADKRCDGVTGVPWTILLEQYRMAPAIRRIVSATTYHNTLRDAEVISTRSSHIIGLDKAVPETKEGAVFLIPHQCRESKSGSSIKNYGESDLIFKLLQEMLRNGVPSEAITVLTLYDAQRQLIAQIAPPDIEVLNVDGFQGRENRIIVLSLVRSNTKGDIGFAASPNRLNVAISRAKDFLFIVGDIETFKKHNTQTWTTFLNNLADNATLLSL